MPHRANDENSGRAITIARVWQVHYERAITEKKKSNHNSTRVAGALRQVDKKLEVNNQATIKQLNVRKKSNHNSTHVAGALRQRRR
jgi:hypothetical protein